MTFLTIPNTKTKKFSKQNQKNIILSLQKQNHLNKKQQFTLTGPNKDLNKKLQIPPCSLIQLSLFGDHFLHTQEMSSEMTAAGL
jgi:hypothetical protein